MISLVCNSYLDTSLFRLETCSFLINSIYLYKYNNDPQVRLQKFGANPVGPTSPTSPVGPATPMFPTEPVGPIIPVNPNPVGPTSPTSPVGPVTPMFPTEPKWIHS
jgi:hypothetical protein